MDFPTSTVTNKIIDQLYISDEDNRVDTVKVSSVDLTQLVSNVLYNIAVGVGEGGTGTGGWHKLYSFEPEGCGCAGVV
jgi:hypothetical protein